jgi:hypothetical protein
MINIKHLTKEYTVLVSEVMSYFVTPLSTISQMQSVGKEPKTHTIWPTVAFPFQLYGTPEVALT